MSRSAIGGITVVHPDATHSQWVPVAPAQTIYNGCIVGGMRIDAGYSEGVEIMQEFTGVADVTNLDTPYGVVIGNNNYNEAFNSTYKSAYITAAAAGAPFTNTTDFRNVEGPWSKGDSGSRAFVKIERIFPHTVLRAPLFNDAVGTAPTLLTVTSQTTGGATGVGCTSNSAEVAGVADLGTIYYRSGANAGCYRVTDDSSATAHTHDVATPFAISAGDTAVKVPLRPFGMCFARFGTDDAYNGYINTSATAATNYGVIWVLRLDLSEAGNEYCDFTFDGVMFNSIVRENTTA
jgi:hypothetical protein